MKILLIVNIIAICIIGAGVWAEPTKMNAAMMCLREAVR